MRFIAPFVAKKKNRLASALALVLVAGLLAVLLAPTVFAQNTYVITDGKQVTVHTTYTEDPDEVLSEAGIQLDENDFYTTQATQGGSEIILRRARGITIYYCGETVLVDTHGERLVDILQQLNMRYGDGYQVSVPLATQTYDGMQVTIDRVVRKQETYTVEVPFEVVYVNDDTMEEGQEEVISAGTSGLVMRTANVTYKNGMETERIVVEETSIRETVAKVIAVGTGLAVGTDRTMPLIGDGVIVLPTGEVLTYTRTEQFLATMYTHMDDGCDYTTATGTTVRHGVVAVDPTIIPYGTRMFIVTNDGYCVYGLSTAEDCGSAIKGNRLDLYVDNLYDAFQFGRRDCTVYFLGDANWC